MTADTPSPSEVVEKLTALRVMCESCNQPLYVEILDEVLSALSSPRSSTVDEATVEAVALIIERADNDCDIPEGTIDHPEVSSWGEHLARKVLASLPSATVGEE